MRYTVTHEHLRFARQQLAERRATRLAKLERDKADLDRQVEAQKTDLDRQAAIDIQEIEAELAAIETAEKVNAKWSSVPVNAAPNGGDGRAASEPRGDTIAAEESVRYPNGNDEGVIGERPVSETGYVTQREKILRVLELYGDSEGLSRSEIERLVQKEFGKPIPPQNISTNLFRLKKKEHLVSKDHDDRWFLTGGSAR